MRDLRRRHLTSPPANPLDDDDLVAEFLLRLPRRPSSLPCAGSVCKTWRRVATDPHFLRRFRARHGTPPLLGFFDPCGKFFPSTLLEAPDRVPSARLSGDWNDVVDCRDGLVLCRRGSKLQVLDLMTGDRSAMLTTEAMLPVTLRVQLVVDSTAAVDRLCFHFRLIALTTDAGHKRFTASVYSSDSGAWTHSREAWVFPRSTVGFIRYLSTQVGNALYWFHEDIGIISCDLETRKFVFFDDVPWNQERRYDYDCRYLFMTKDGLLCIVMIDKYEHSILFWVWETVLSSAAKWVLRKKVQLHTIPLELRSDWPKLKMVWFEEEKNVIFLLTRTGIVTFNLESMTCMKVSEEFRYNKVYPYSSFMTAGRDVALSVDEVDDRFIEATE